MKRTITILIFVVMPLLVICQTKDDESDAVKKIRKLDNEFHTAFRTADYATLNRLLADKFIWTHSTGEIQTKAEILADIKSGELKYESLTTDDVQIYVYKNAAVVSGHSTRNYLREKSFQIRYSVFYVKQRGKWQAVAFHTSILSKAT